MPGCAGYRLLSRGGTQVGVWGLGSLDPAQDAGALLVEAKRLTNAARGAGAEIVIGLWSGDARLARRIAGATPGLDFMPRAAPTART